MKRGFIFVLFAAFLLTGCGGRDYREAILNAETLFYKGQPLEASRILIPEVNKSGRDQIIFMMEAGYMLHAAEEYEKSNKILLRAADMAKVTPISVSEQVKVLMTNPRAATYRGEDFEKVLINMYIGINYLVLEQYEEAAVEFKRVNNELAKIKSESGQARYKQNIMAKYLTSIAHEIVADISDSDEDREYATVELRQILQLQPGLFMAQKDLGLVEQKLQNMGELIVIFECGKSAIKESRGPLLNDPGMNSTVNASIGSGAIAQSLAAGVTAGAIMLTLQKAENPIPKFTYRPTMISHLNVRVKNINFNTIALENISATAVQNLEDDYGRLRGQLVASIVVKAATSLAVGLGAKAAAKQIGGVLGQFSGLIGTVAGAGTGAALFASMRPDLRCWHTLPANLQLARQRLSPGQYTATLSFIGNNGGIVKTKDVTFEIKDKHRKVLSIRSYE